MTPSAHGLLTATVEKSLRSTSGRPLIKLQPHAGQKAVLKLIAEAVAAGARFFVLVAHRRWGKNWLCIHDALQQAKQLTEQPGREQLNPRVVVWFVFPTYLLADELWSDLKAMVAGNEGVRTINTKPYVMEMPGGIHIHVRSADHPEHLVAAGIDLLYMIEAARMKEGAWLTIRPTLTSHGREGRCIFNTTPLRRNWLYRAWQQSQDPLAANWAGCRIPAYNEDGTRHEWSIMPSDERIADEREDYPDSWFRQEYGAEFVETGGAVFRDVRSRIAAVPAEPTRPVVAGVDLAKVVDFTVFVAFDGARRMVGFERMHGIPYPQQSVRLCHFLGKHNVKTVAVESNGPGEAFMDILKSDLYDTGIQCQVEGVATTAQSKEQMIQRLAMGIQKAQVTVLNEPVLLEELEAYEITKTPAGNERYGAPEGEHDDTVMACALAFSQLKRTGARPRGSIPGAEPGRGLRKEPFGGQLYRGFIGGGRR